VTTILEFFIEHLPESFAAQFQIVRGSGLRLLREPVKDEDSARVLREIKGAIDSTAIAQSQFVHSPADGRHGPGRGHTQRDADWRSYKSLPNSRRTCSGKERTVAIAAGWKSASFIRIVSHIWDIGSMGQRIETREKADAEVRSG
jgi:hypothetical protein